VFAQGKVNSLKRFQIPCKHDIFEALLTDSFQRPHHYLRISLTDACNLRCFYCMPDEDSHCTPHHQLMQTEEIFALAKTFVGLGVNKIRITGGEPLVRKEFPEILKALSTLPVQLTLTSNGVFLDKYLNLLKECGVKSINISLDTLDREKFILLTKRDNLDIVNANINKAIEHGFHVKVNMVVMKGINDNELLDFAEWSVDSPLHIRFIEFMPFAGNQWHHDKVFTRDQMLQTLAGKFDFIPLDKEPHETAHKYFIRGAKGSFAVISTMSHPFCGDCNRLRLTADGKMRNCLFATHETDLLTALRSGEPIEPLIIENLKQKQQKLGGQFDEHFEKIQPETLQNRSMIAIGG
jgi:cyclic pyranopterin phosphate synthase